MGRHCEVCLTNHKPSKVGLWEKERRYFLPTPSYIRTIAIADYVATSCDRTKAKADRLWRK